MARISSSQPARPSRQTRSQSAEPVASTALQQQQQDRRTATRSKSPQKKQRAPSKRANKTHQMSAPSLTPVQEDGLSAQDDAEQDADPDNVDNEDQLQEHILNHSQTAHSPSRALTVIEPALHRRVSSYSAISGTTAKTSFSHEEMEEMDAEEMEDALPSLASTADDFSKFLAPSAEHTSPETWKEIRTPGSRLSKLYSRRREFLNLHKRSFGTQQYIQPRNVLRALLDVDTMDDVSDAPWRPDNILFKANLAEMLDTILIVCNTTDGWTSTASDALERLHAAFPEAIAGSEFSSRTLHYFLDLMAQLTICRIDASISSEPNFSPIVIIDNLFYDEEDYFRHMDDLGISNASEVDLGKARSDVEQVVQDLKRPFINQADVTAANGRLKAKYRWDNLKISTLRFYEQRVREVDRYIAAVGGVQEIQQQLRLEVQRRRDYQEAERIRSKHTKPAATSTPRASLSAMATLKQLVDGSTANQTQEPQHVQAPAKAQATASTAPVSMPNQAPAAQMTSGPPPDVADYDFGNPSSAPSYAPTGLSMAASFREKKLQQLQKQSPRAPGRFIDPQPNARRVGWEEDELSQQGTPRPTLDQRHVAPASASRKRTYADMERDDHQSIPDPTQDEGFETDTRDVKRADQRRREVQFAERSNGHALHRRHDSVPVSSIGASSAYDPYTRDDTPNVSDRMRLNPGSTIVAYNEEPPPASEDLPEAQRFARYKIASRQHTAVANTKKTPQLRRPWADEEEDALFDLIVKQGHDGFSWTVLKKFDDSRMDNAKLAYRSAEDMRFKARNMKVTMLIGQLPQHELPPNWEHVRLDKKAIDKVHRHGVAYTQEKQRGIN